VFDINLDGFTFKNDGKEIDFFLQPVWGDDGKEKRRHLLFATKLQLKMLANCYRWYMDGTFKLVASPFKQLWSIHGFIKCPDGNMNQEAFFHCQMTRRGVAKSVTTKQFLLTFWRNSMLRMYQSSSATWKRHCGWQLRAVL